VKKTEAVEFYIDVLGETSGEQYKGNFKALPRLSHRLDLLRDKKRRELLGNLPGASERALILAGTIAELHVRLTDYPKWWPEVGFGLDLEDEMPLVDITNHIKRIIDEEEQKVADKGKAAEEKLRAKAAAEAEPKE
jgi:hypothetical protein